MRIIPALLISAALSCLSAQSLPPYLIDTVPAPNATGVATNANIILRSHLSLPLSAVAGTGYYTLKSSAGTSVPFQPLPSCECFSTVLAPSTQLSPNTKYTFTVSPGADVGEPYSFSFTTGGGPDLTPPRLLSVDPPSGTSGVGLSGPFKFQFDKRLVRALQRNLAVQVVAKPNYVNASYPALSLSEDGATLIVRPNPSQRYPSAYDITVDPAQFVDAFGNAGQGAALTVSYTTFIATDSSGPSLSTSLPSNGDAGVPTNVRPRLVFDRPISTFGSGKAIELQADGVPVDIALSAVPVSELSSVGSSISIVPAKLLSPGTNYSIVIGPELKDLNGFSIQAPPTVQFTTGSGPDTAAPVVLSYSPGFGTASPNARILVRTNKPVAAIVASRLTQAGLTYGSFGEFTSPVTATLSTDGTLLTMVPLKALDPHEYRVRTSEIVDNTGLPFFPDYPAGSAIRFTVSGNAVQGAPELLAIHPSPDSTSIRLNTVIQLRFDKVCANCLFPGVIGVFADGVPASVKVSAAYSLNGKAFFVNMDGSLSPATTYTVSLSGAMSASGEVMPDYSFRFTTAETDVASQPLSLVESSIANGDTGVNPMGPFVLRYSAVLNAYSAFGSCMSSDQSYFYYPLESRASGDTLTITPKSGLPANATFQLSCEVYDVAGASIRTDISFTTASIDDSAPPEVVSISPPSGTTLTDTPGQFALSACA